VHEVAVNVKDRRLTWFLVNDVAVPYLFE
jgi:hypothetical protein